MKLMRAIGKVHVEDPAMVKSTDPEQEGQESCGRSPSDEIRGRSKRRVVVSTRIVQSLSRTDERRGLARTPTSDGGVQTKTGGLGDRDLSPQKNEWPEECLLSSPNFPSQRPRWRTGRASGATQTTVVHNKVHRGEVEDMNGWRWMGKRGGGGEGEESRRIELSRGRVGDGDGLKSCQDQGGASVLIVFLVVLVVLVGFFFFCLSFGFDRLDCHVTPAPLISLFLMEPRGITVPDLL